VVEPRAPEPNVEEVAAATRNGLRMISAIAAFAFLGGAIGYFIGTPDVPGPDSVDVGFYQDMITHHDQAVAMSLIELDNGADPVARSYAREIVLFQRYEIGRMDEALRRWGANGERPQSAMTWMGHAVPVEEMPGLATPQQLDDLRAADGADADALFLELMIEHHRAGVDMAEYARTEASDNGVRALADVMATNQNKEIAELSATADALRLAIADGATDDEHAEHDG
jgi:uncharacterized protein (DUF305 family)